MQLTYMSTRRMIEWGPLTNNDTLIKPLYLLSDIEYGVPSLIRPRDWVRRRIPPHHTAHHSVTVRDLVHSRPDSVHITRRLNRLTVSTTPSSLAHQDVVEDRVVGWDLQLAALGCGGAAVWLVGYTRVLECAVYLYFSCWWAWRCLLDLRYDLEDLSISSTYIQNYFRISIKIFRIGYWVQ